MHNGLTTGPLQQMDFGKHFPGFPGIGRIKYCVLQQLLSVGKRVGCHGTKLARQHSCHTLDTLTNQIAPRLYSGIPFLTI